MTAPSPQRAALVTGGAVRVGAAISLGLAEAGYELAIGYRSSDREARALGERIEGLGRRVVIVPGDLALPEACRTLVAEAHSAFGRIDLVVNSASTFASRSLEDVDAEAWNHVLAVNARAAHLVVRAAADLLRAARGAVVNVVDGSAFEPWASYPDHSVSKAALAHLTRVQAKALAPEVRVNAVAPGAVLKPDDWPDDRWTRIARAAPLARSGSPQDVVEAVLYLARAGYVTGQVLAVDGGRSLGTASAGT